MDHISGFLHDVTSVPIIQHLDQIHLWCYFLGSWFDPELGCVLWDVNLIPKFIESLQIPEFLCLT